MTVQWYGNYIHSAIGTDGEGDSSSMTVYHEYTGFRSFTSLTRPGDLHSVILWTSCELLTTGAGGNQRTGNCHHLGEPGESYGTRESGTETKQDNCRELWNQGKLGNQGQLHGIWESLESNQHGILPSQASTCR